MSGIDWADLAAEPLEQLSRWLGEAQRAGLPLYDAMTLATANAAGRPAARIVLLKRLDPSGLVFTTNGCSRKCAELRDNPYACVVFHWPALPRQVRVEGIVETCPDELSDALFEQRPRESQLGAWASDQSRVIDGRATLLARLEQARARFGGEVPRPPHWGAFRLRPETVEFWHRREARLHDRLRFRRRGDGGWLRERLCP